MEKYNVAGSQTIRAALTRGEQLHPGLSYDLAMAIIARGEIKVNMNESILRLQGTTAEPDCKSLIAFLTYNLFLQYFCIFSNGIPFK